MNVGVVGNPRYGDLPAVLQDIAREAPRRGIELFTEESLIPFWASAPPLIDDYEKLDALLTCGGDGTLLRVARMLAGAEVPILGLNLGQVGFLTTATRDGLPTALDALVSGKFVLERRLGLHSQIHGTNGEPKVEQFALNDVVVHKGGVARVIRVRVLIEGEDVGPYSADGIIVASPTGSTAYSLSAGGPIVVPGVEAMIVTPVCPHTLSVRPLVVPAEYTIQIEPVAPWDEDLLISYDGQLGSVIDSGDRVCVRRAEHAVRLVRLGGEGYISRMRQKLNWGDLLDRQTVR